MAAWDGEQEVAPHDSQVTEDGEHEAAPHDSQVTQVGEQEVAQHDSKVTEDGERHRKHTGDTTAVSCSSRTEDISS